MTDLFLNITHNALADSNLQDLLPQKLRKHDHHNVNCKVDVNQTLDKTTHAIWGTVTQLNLGLVYIFIRWDICHAISLIHQIYAIQSSQYKPLSQ